MNQPQSVSELLRRIEDEALDGDVVKALLLCQKLGGHAHSEALRSWAEKELNGWPPSQELPEYRMLEGAMVGHGSDLGGAVRMTIPTDSLPRELLDAGALGIPVRSSISAVQQTSEQESILVMPSHSSVLANFLTETNQGSAVFGQIHLHCPGSVYGGIVTAVRSKLISLVSELGRSLPANITINNKKVKMAVSKAADNLVVLGDHNVITMGDKSKAIGDNRRWMSGRRGVAAVTTGAVAFGGAILELLRRESIWSF